VVQPQARLERGINQSWSTEKKKMAIPTSRTSEPAEITINRQLCRGCGSCVEVCKDSGLVIREGKAEPSDEPIFGCIGCGHCMAICPSGAILIRGRALSPEDLIPLPEDSETPSWQSMYNLLLKRRSIREFTGEPVERELIEKVIDAARTAPMGLPPSDVNLLIFPSRESVRAFTEDFCSHLRKIEWFFSDWTLSLMRPLMGKETTELFRSFAKPLVEKYQEGIEKNVDLVTYDAPVAIYFYGSPYCDPADPIIAATYAMITAESLGLGACMLGAIHPLIQSGRSARKLRKKHGIKSTSREGLFLIMGHPSVAYRKGIKRTFASVTYAR